MSHSWLASRATAFDSSGIRKVFDLAAKMKDPINLSIGQPDFDVPEAARQAMVEAVQSGKNGYAQTQGITPLLEKLQAQVQAEFGHADRKVFVTSGTSGGLLVAIMALVNPGDEVISVRSVLCYLRAAREVDGRPRGVRRNVSKIFDRFGSRARRHYQQNQGDIV